MPKIIKRTKTTLDVNGNPASKTTRYATGVAAKGNITGLTENRAAAAAFTDEVCAKVVEFHKGLKNAGELTFETAPEDAVVSAPAAVAPDPREAELLSKAQDKLDRLTQEHKELQASFEELDKTATERQAQIVKQNGVIGELEKKIAELQKHAEPLTATSHSISPPAHDPKHGKQK